MALNSSNVQTGSPSGADQGIPKRPSEPYLLIFSKDPAYSPGDRAAWIMFLAASFQAVFYWPPLVLVPGQGTRLSTAILGGLSLAALFLTKAKSRIRVKPAEVLVCLALTGLGLTSAFLSSAPWTALLRTLTLFLPGLGGYWCARVLLRDPVRRKSFINLGLILLTGFTILRLIQHFTALPRGLEASCKHPTAGLIYILFFAPLALAATRKKSQALFGLALMISGWALSILMYLKTAMVIPLFMALTALLKKRLRPMYLGIILLALAGLAIILPRFYTQARIDQDLESIYYRAESYPFSWHMATKHPLLGNGLLAPRQQYLEGYWPVFEAMKRGVLEKYTAEIQVSENIVLTFLTDLGLPFTLIYVLALGLVMGRAFGKKQPPGKGGDIPHLALILPLTAWAVHSMVFDSLLHPQICWFVHILLGLLVNPEQAPPPGQEVLS